MESHGERKGVLSDRANNEYTSGAPDGGTQVIGNVES